MATYFSVCSYRKVSKREPPQSTSPHEQHEGSFVTPDLCGCCGTHELHEEKRNSLKHPHRKLHINHSLLCLLNGEVIQKKKAKVKTLVIPAQAGIQ